MRLRWTTPATNDLFNIVQHIQQDNPDAAPKVAETLYDGCSSLENFPHLGRKGRIAGTRELVFSALLTSLSIALLTRSSRFFASITELRTGHSQQGPKRPPREPTARFLMLDVGIERHGDL